MDIYTYSISLPPKVREIVVPSGDGYTVYTNAAHAAEAQRAAYEHARRHIARGDFEKTNVQQIEKEAHG